MSKHEQMELAFSDIEEGDAIISSSGVVSDFIERNVVWQDMLNILQRRLRSIRDGLEVMNDTVEIHRFQGAATEIRVLMDLPDVLYQELLLKEQERNKDD